MVINSMVSPIKKFFFWIVIVSEPPPYILYLINYLPLTSFMIDPPINSQKITSTYFSQDLSSICFTLPHFLRLTHFRDRFCLHFLSQAPHVLHCENWINFLWDETLLSLPTPLSSLSLLLISSWLKSLESFSLVVLLEICVCCLLKSTSLICK